MLAQHAKDAFSEVGFYVNFNRPFSGALVPISFWKQRKSVSAIMIEIRRDLYMNETTGNRLASFEGIVDKIGSIVTSILNHFMESSPTNH